MSQLQVFNNPEFGEVREKCLTNGKNYWTWGNGKSYPQLASRKAIADAFGLKIEDIFSARDECGK